MSGAGNEPTSRGITVDIVADPACPWCYVGVRTYALAAREIAKNRPIVTRFRPYFLNPETPDDGFDRRAYYARKFPDAERLNQMRAALSAAAEEIGAPFDPAGPDRYPNTRRAHQLTLLAQYHGVHEAVAIDVYDAYWRDQQDIGDRSALVAIGERHGLSALAIDAAFAETADAIDKEAQAFRDAGVSGVPTFIVNEMRGFTGALGLAELAATIERAAAPDSPPSPPNGA